MSARCVHGRSHCQPHPLHEAWEHLREQRHKSLPVRVQAALHEAQHIHQRRPTVGVQEHTQPPRQHLQQGISQQGNHAPGEEDGFGTQGDVSGEQGGHLPGQGERGVQCAVQGGHGRVKAFQHVADAGEAVPQPQPHPRAAVGLLVRRHRPCRGMSRRTLHARHGLLRQHTAPIRVGQERRDDRHGIRRRLLGWHPLLRQDVPDELKQVPLVGRLQGSASGDAAHRLAARAGGSVGELGVGQGRTHQRLHMGREHCLAAFLGHELGQAPRDKGASPPHCLGRRRDAPFSQCHAQHGRQQGATALGRAQHPVVPHCEVQEGQLGRHVGQAAQGAVKEAREQPGQGLCALHTLPSSHGALPPQPCQPQD